MAPVINLKSIGSATSGARATSARTSILDWIAVRTGRLSPGRDVAVTFRSNTGGSVVHIAGRDPGTNQLTPLFNPRSQLWEDHFALQGAYIVGRTAIGRTTVLVLNMNSDEQLELRAVEHK